MSEYLPEGKLIDTRENQAVLRSPRLLKEASEDGIILEARAKLCDSSHNLCVELGNMRADGLIRVRKNHFEIVRSE